MYELPKKEYNKVFLLFEKLKVDRLVVLNVIKAHHPGRIFVDHTEKPTAAMIIAGSCYLGGDARNADFNEQLKDLLTTETLSRSAGEPLFIFSTTDEWKDVVGELLHDYEVIRIKRYKFVLDLRRFQQHVGWKGRVPEGYDVKKVHRPVAKCMPNYAFEYWGNIEAFLTGGFGFAVTKGNELVSVCWTMLLGEGIAELAVETDKSYRRRGFATLASCACIDHCLENGLRPEWDCFELPASMNLAQKLGFVKKLDVEVQMVKKTES
jgi:GNAT superfamily N-acetyltransferase